MSAPPAGERDRAEALHASLGRVRLGVLATLAGCALVSFLKRDAAPAALAPALSATFTALAVLLGLGSAFARQAGAMRTVSVTTRVFALLGAFLLAGGIGIVGVVAALGFGDGTRGLLYALAGAIFAVRGVPPLDPPARR